MKKTFVWLFAAALVANFGSAFAETDEVVLDEEQEQVAVVEEDTSALD